MTPELSAAVRGASGQTPRQSIAYLAAGAASNMPGAVTAQTSSTSEVSSSPAAKGPTAAETAMEEAKERRIALLTDRLLRKIEPYVRGTDPEAFRLQVVEEAEELRHESCGARLLRAIGYVYAVKADQQLARHGLAYVWHHARQKGHTVRSVYRTTKAFMDMQQTIKHMEKMNLMDDAPTVGAPATPAKLSSDPSQSSHPEPDNPGGSTGAKVVTATPSAGLETKREEISSEGATSAEHSEWVDVEGAETAAAAAEEERTQWTSKLMSKGLELLWQGNRIDTELVLCTVCDRVLSSINAADHIRLKYKSVFARTELDPNPTRALRAKAP